MMPQVDTRFNLPPFPSEAAKRPGPLWRNQPPAAWEACTIPLTRCRALIGFAYEFKRFSIRQWVVGRFFLSPDEPAIEAALNRNEVPCRRFATCGFFLL